MALQYSPKIVQDSLVMCLDASQNKSYPAADLPVKNGLNLWLDAADDTTFSYSSGTSVSQWRDKSGNNFHASQATVLSQPSRSTFQNSRKTVNFDGTNDTVTISNFISNSEMSIFVVSNCGNTLFIEHSTDTNSNQGFYFYGNGNGMFAINRSPGVIYTSITNWLSGGYSVASAVNSTGLDLLTYKDGTQQTPTYDGRASRSNSYVTSTLYIGSRGANSLWSSGPIAEIIIYNRKVTNVERNLIHTYLGQKWGISNTDRSIVDLAGNDDNGLFGGAAGSQTVANMPVYDYYNKGAFKFFANNKYIKLGISTVVNQFAGDFAVSLWAMATAENSNYGNLIGDWYTAGTTTLNEWQIMMNNSSTFLVVYHQTAGTPISARSSGFSANTWINVVLSRVGSTLTLYANNNAIGTVTNSSIFGSTTGNVNIGIDGDSSSERFTGLISNVLIYRKGLSAVEVAQNYEAQKSKFANTIVQQGLVLNLDAGNPYSYAGSGTTWIDVSGIGNSGTLTNGPSYTSDNSGGILFDGSDDYVNVPYNASTISFPTNNATVCVWYKVSTTGDGVGCLVTQRSSGGSGIQTYAMSSRLFADGGGTAGISSNTIISNGTIAFGTIVYDKTNSLLKLYVNGVFDSQISYTGTIQDTYPIRLGNGAFSDGPFPGTIYMAQVYNIALSAAQVLQNYNATKGRFGL